MSYTSLPRAWYVYFFKLFLLAAGTAGLFLGPQRWPVPCQGWAGSAWSRPQLWSLGSVTTDVGRSLRKEGALLDLKQAVELGAGALTGVLPSGGGQVSGLLSEGRHWDGFGSLWAAAGAHRAAVWPSREHTVPQARLRQAEATVWGVGGSGVATTSACTESLFPLWCGKLGGRWDFWSAFGMVSAEAPRPCVESGSSTGSCGSVSPLAAAALPLSRVADGMISHQNEASSVIWPGFF